MTKRTGLLAVLGLSVLGMTARADDWPQWRGPNRDDVSKETGLLKTWPKEGPKLVWTFTEGGNGFSGPAVVGKRLYTMGAWEKKEYIFALDIETGKKVWATEVGTMYENGWGSGPRCTPTVDGDLVYALDGNGDLTCLKAADGAKVWSISMSKDLDGQMGHGWGYCESVLVDGDQVVCTPGSEKGAMAALDKKTGKVIWRTDDLKDKASSSSIIIVNVGGKRHYVQMTQASVAGVSPENGKVLWRFPRNGSTAAVPTPIFKDHFVYAVSGYGVGCQLLDLTADGDKLSFKEVYSKDIKRNMDNKHGGVVRVGDYLYGYSDGKGWVCQKFDSGEIVWPEMERKKLDSGSLTFADGHLYCYQENGTAALVEANPQGWKESGRFEIPQKTKLKRGNGQIWTHPVVANGKLYLRDNDLIFCYDIKAP